MDWFLYDNGLRHERVNVALCGMRCVNLHEDTMKIIGFHYSYNKQLENDKNFKKHIAKIEKCVKTMESEEPAT